ncbi:hypothetical protein D3C86_1476650 [compost metagenome]
MIHEIIMVNVTCTVPHGVPNGIMNNFDLVIVILDPTYIIPFNGDRTAGPNFRQLLKFCPPGIIEETEIGTCFCRSLWKVQVIIGICHPQTVSFGIAIVIVSIIARQSTCKLSQFISVVSIRCCNKRITLQGFDIAHIIIAHHLSHTCGTGRCTSSTCKSVEPVIAITKVFGCAIELIIFIPQLSADIATPLRAATIPVFKLQTEPGRDTFG